jgi:hypothetical protein
MDNCRRWFPCASCLGCHLCVKRFPPATHEAIRLAYFRSHTDLYDQYFCAGHCCFFRWSLAQSHRTQNCRSHGRVSVRLGSLPGKFLRSPALVALPQLWGNRRHRSWIELHSAGRRPWSSGSLSPRPDHRCCRRRVRSGSTGDGARRHPPHSERGRSLNICLPPYRASHRHSCRRLSCKIHLRVGRPRDGHRRPCKPPSVPAMTTHSGRRWEPGNGRRCGCFYSIHTENSYKFNTGTIDETHTAGWILRHESLDRSRANVCRHTSSRALSWSEADFRDPVVKRTQPFVGYEWAFF